MTRSKMKRRMYRFTDINGNDFIIDLDEIILVEESGKNKENSTITISATSDYQDHGALISVNDSFTVNKPIKTIERIIEYGNEAHYLDELHW